MAKPQALEMERGGGIARDEVWGVVLWGFSVEGNTELRRKMGRGKGKTNRCFIVI